MKNFLLKQRRNTFNFQILIEEKYFQLSNFERREILPNFDRREILPNVERSSQRNRKPGAVFTSNLFLHEMIFSAREQGDDQIFQLDNICFNIQPESEG